jgi:hypothetical protein
VEKTAINCGGCVWGSVLQIYAFEMSGVHVDMVQGSIGVTTRGRTSYDAGRKSLRSALEHSLWLHQPILMDNIPGHHPYCLSNMSLEVNFVTFSSVCIVSSSTLEPPASWNAPVSNMSSKTSRP